MQNERKKLALIIISLDECFPKEGFSGGGHKVTQKLILGLIDSQKFDIDIYAKKGEPWHNTIEGISSINIIGKKNFKGILQQKLAEKKYDYVLSSDILLPFANNLIHSNSSKFKSQNGKNAFLKKLLRVYNSGKIRLQEKNLPDDKAIFTVSQSLKNDYVENYDVFEGNVFVAHPAIDETTDFVAPEKNEIFTIGSMAGGGLNKGGYLLLMALKLLPKKTPIKARIIFPKFEKSGFYRFLIKFLKLEDKIKLLPKQSNMKSFYESIDCYVLPSLNEAFGLVVTEAASNFKPSLVSSTTGVRELIENNKNGFVFDREKTPIKNLAERLIEITDLYLYDFETYTEISKNAHKIAERLDWHKFTDTIIENMIPES